MRNELLLEYSYLGDGETVGSQLCPACGGGSRGERSMSVSRRGDSLLWKCHRASCGYSGVAGSKGYQGGTTKPVTTKGVVGRIYLRDADPLPAELVTSLVDRYHLGSNELALLGFDSESGRIVLPVPNAEGEMLGCVLRSESGAQPKALAYVEENAVAIFRNYSSDKLYIVEDIYSAIRASKYVNAAAILGTHLNTERITTLKYLGCKENYLALDADAYDKAVKYCIYFRGQLQMVPVKLTRDLKNLTDEELRSVLNA